jgi:hypothetical protein
MLSLLGGKGKKIGLDDPLQKVLKS